MTKQEYATYKERVYFYLKDVKAVSTGPCPGCKECGIPDDTEDYSEEPWFSWRRCEICDRPEGGDRVSWHGIIDNEIVHGSCCADCEYYLAMGCLDDMTMLGIEEDTLTECKECGEKFAWEIKDQQFCSPHCRIVYNEEE